MSLGFKKNKLYRKEDVELVKMTAPMAKSLHKTKPVLSEVCMHYIRKGAIVEIPTVSRGGIQPDIVVNRKMAIKIHAVREKFPLLLRALGRCVLYLSSYEKVLLLTDIELEDDIQMKIRKRCA